MLYTPMTHDPAVPYMDYIERLAANLLAREVKAMDLTHNMELARLAEVTEENVACREKYGRALGFLAAADEREKTSGASRNGTDQGGIGGKEIE